MNTHTYIYIYIYIHIYIYIYIIFSDLKSVLKAMSRAGSPSSDPRRARRAAAARLPGRRIRAISYRVTSYYSII